MTILENVGKTLQLIMFFSGFWGQKPYWNRLFWSILGPLRISRFRTRPGFWPLEGPGPGLIIWLLGVLLALLGRRNQYPEAIFGKNQPFSQKFASQIFKFGENSPTLKKLQSFWERLFRKIDGNFHMGNFYPNQPLWGPICCSQQSKILTDFPKLPKSFAANSCEFAKLSD